MQMKRDTISIYSEVILQNQTGIWAENAQTNDRHLLAVAVL
jgi:hypothetical protein